MHPGSYFKFDGRLGRAGFAAGYGVPFLLLGALPGLLLPHGAAQVLLESAVFLLVLPGVSRRLHDLNRSLWLATGLWAIYGAVLAIQTTGFFGNRRSLAILVADLPLFVLILLLFVLRGSHGANQYGEATTKRKEQSAV